MRWGEVPLSEAQIWPMICNNLETARDRNLRRVVVIVWILWEAKLLRSHSAIRRGINIQWGRPLSLKMFAQIDVIPSKTRTGADVLTCYFLRLYFRRVVLFFKSDQLQFLWLHKYYVKLSNNLPPQNIRMTVPTSSSWPLTF